MKCKPSSGQRSIGSKLPTARRAVVEANTPIAPCSSVKKALKGSFGSADADWEVIRGQLDGLHFESVRLAFTPFHMLG